MTSNHVTSLLYALHHTRTPSSVDVRVGSSNNLEKAAKQVNDARFTKVKDPVKKSKDPRFSKAGAAPPKNNDAGSKQVKQKMTARKSDQGAKKGSGSGGGLMDQGLDGGYLTA